MDAIGTAVSGLSAAEKRLQTSAQNVANQLSEGYKAKKIEQEALEAGGVKVDVVKKNPATITVANPEGGTQELPNVNEAEEVAQQVIASYTYKANLKTIQVQQDLQEALLNITA